MSLEQSVHKMTTTAEQLTLQLEGYTMTADNARELDQSVIDLHNIARRIEELVGNGQLSDDVRKCADRLNQLLRPL